jgi:hypothetical protein
MLAGGQPAPGENPIEEKAERLFVSGLPLNSGELMGIPL